MLLISFILSGNCDIHPKKGYALTTNFSISCNGWIDEDKPLTYTVRVIKDSTFIILCLSSKSTCGAILPIDQDGRFQTKVEIVISDSFHASTAILELVNVSSLKILSHDYFICCYKYKRATVQFSIGVQKQSTYCYRIRDSVGAARDSDPI